MIPPLALAALISFLVCLLLTALVRKFCVRFHVLDYPGTLKIHSRPIPRLGGIALTLAIAAGVLISNRTESRATAYFFLALAIVWFAGFADDLHALTPHLRLAAQVTSGIVLWLGGWRLAPGEGPLRTGPISLLLIVGLIAVFTNSWNLFDGSDGIAAGNAGIVAASYLAISRAAGEPLTLIVAVSLSASCAAFLPYNWPPAKIYLGDGGSTVLGFCIAFLALCPANSNSPSAALHLSPLIIPGVPLVDTALAVVRRVSRGVSIFQGDRSHLYDRLLALGWSARRVALATYALTLILAITAWFGTQFGLPEFLLLSGLGLAGILILAVRLGCLRSAEPTIASRARIDAAAGNPATKPL